MSSTTLEPSSGWRWDPREGAAWHRYAQRFSARGAFKNHSPDEDFSLGKFFSESFPKDSSFQLQLNPEQGREWAAVIAEPDPKALLQNIAAFAQRLEASRQPVLALALYDRALLAYGAVDGLPSELRNSFQARFESLQGRGDFGIRAETLSRNFLQNVTDYRSLTAYTLASAVFPLVKSASLARLLRGAPGVWTRGLTAEALAAGTALGAETMAFQISEHSLKTWSGETTTRGFRDTMLELGAFKLFGRLGTEIEARLPIRLNGRIQPVAMFAGLMAARRIEASASDPSLMQSLPDTFFSLIQLMASSHLGQRLLGPDFIRLQSDLESRARASRATANGDGPLLWSTEWQPALAGSRPPSRIHSPLGSKMEMTLMSASCPPEGAGGWLPSPALAEQLTKSYLPKLSRHRLDFSAEKVVSFALRTRSTQPHFHERLLAAYAQAPDRGSQAQQFIALAISDLFEFDAGTSSTGGFDKLVLQTLIHRAITEENPEFRNQVLHATFEAMKNQPSRREFLKLIERWQLDLGFRISTVPTYSYPFWEMYRDVAAHALQGYQPAHVIALLNELEQWAPNDPVSTGHLFRFLREARQDPQYGPQLLDAVLDTALQHPLGSLMVRRLIQVVTVKDLPGKLWEMLDDGPRSDSPEVIAKLKSEGLDDEAIARTINRTYHTGFLDDLRLARKITSTMIEVAPYLLPDHPTRIIAFHQFQKRVKSLIHSGKEIGVDDYFALHGVDAKGNTIPGVPVTPLALHLHQLWKSGELEILNLPETEYKKELGRHKKLNDPSMFFSLAPSADAKHRILIRAVPALTTNGPFDFETIYDEVLYRTAALVHEATHYLQASGKDETIAGWAGARPYQFHNMTRSERLASEIGAYLTEDAWLIKNYEIEWYRVAQVLGINQVMFFADHNDWLYFGKRNQSQINLFRESNDESH